MTPPDDPDDGLGRSQFGRYWTGAAISSYGSAVKSVAVPVLVIDRLHASSIETAMVNAAQLFPYALLGFVVGAYVDR